jgi:hypothetical protein
MEKITPSNGKTTNDIVWLDTMEENNRQAALMEAEARKIEAEIRLQKARMELGSLQPVVSVPLPDLTIPTKPESLDAKIIRDKDIIKIRATEESDRGIKVESLEKYVREGRTNPNTISRTITNGEPAWILAQAAHSKGEEFYAIVKVGQIPQPHFVSFCYQDKVAGTGRKVSGREEYEKALRDHCGVSIPKSRPAPAPSKFEYTMPADQFLRKGEPVSRAAERFAYTVLKDEFGDDVEWTNEKKDQNHFYDLVVFDKTLDVKLTEYQTEDPWMWVSLGVLKTTSRAEALARFRSTDQAKYFVSVYYDKVKGELSMIGFKNRDDYADLFEVRKVRDYRLHSTCVRRESLDNWDTFVQHMRASEAA